LDSAARGRRVMELAERLGADGLLITNPINRRYLSGFGGTAGQLVITADRRVLATDARYTERAADEAPDWEIRNIAGKPNWLADLADELKFTNLCFEADDLTVDAHKRLKTVLKSAKAEIALTPSVALVSKLRRVKNADEIEALIRAVSIGDQAFAQTASGIRAGQTEREVALEFEFNARKLGADCLSFPTIVASGPNAARPHHEPGDRAIRERETIVFDCGVMHNGYCSDLTRTIVIGEPDEQTVAVYRTVLEAQTRAADAIKPGMSGREADAVARDHIAGAGYGERFGHGLGHGVGLEIHEEPYLSQNGAAPLDIGAVVTIEPGIYIPNWGGVRIEDMAVVEKDGARVISAAPKMKV